ncbi:MAG TPA: hypothetical protein DCS20_00715 [Candidatus Yonathbacteria bacterium]|nr:hypothetical protein [Candidatus Yonathbacteria bacterium]
MHKNDSTPRVSPFQRMKYFTSFSRLKSYSKKRLILFSTLLVVLLPICGIVFYSGVEEYKDHELLAISHREATASLAASLVKEKLDRVVDLGVSFSGRTIFRQSIEKGEWEHAVSSIEEVTKKYPYISFITLYDPAGVLKATTSGDPSVVGKSFAYRDYYQGVSKHWEPYVSEVFKKISEPQYNIVSVSIPIWSDKQEVLGILGLNINLGIFNEWVESIDVGNEGFVYVVDQKGHLAAHPYMSAASDVVDYSAAPAVQKIARGEQGVEVLIDPMGHEDQLTAYAPVDLYGWGVVATQPVSVAFFERDREVARFTVIWVLIMLATGLSLFRILRDRAIIKAQRDREGVLMESIGDGVVAIDRNWRITMWNKAAHDITGWTKQEAIGKPLQTILKFIRERDRAEDTSFIEGAMVIGRRFSIIESTLIQTKDGREIYAGDSAAPIFGEQGVVDGAIVVFRDITKEREENRMRSDFAYAAHQLRTPVTEALWNLDMAMEEEDARKIKESLPVVHNALESIQKLSENLVVLSEIDRGDIIVSKTSIGIADILAEVQQKIKATAQKFGVEVLIDAHTVSVTVNTNKKMLKRVLSEVIENAVAYSPRGSKVNIIATVSDQEVVVEVADSGKGIPQEQQGIIFTKFFRGSNKGSESVGSGLGLFIAKEYMKLLGGKIWFTSEEGKGSTFYTSVPVV